MRKEPILLLIFFTTALAVAAQSSENHRPSLLNRAGSPTTWPSSASSPNTSASSSPSASTTNPSFVFHRQGTSALLYLKNDLNQVTLRVTNAVGQVQHVRIERNMDGGFYEFPLPGPHFGPGVYLVKFTINDQTVAFRIVL